MSTQIDRKIIGTESPLLVEVYTSLMRAHRLVADNIMGLLRQRGFKQRDLAQWCRKSDVWASLVLAGKRELLVRDLDRIADFFGLATYQLLQPGVTRTTERRKAERRSGLDRRISNETRLARDLEGRVRPLQSSHAPSAQTSAIGRLVADFERRLSRLISEADTGRQTPSARQSQPKTRTRPRTDGGSDAETSGVK